jgi:hypothetical protein
VSTALLGSLRPLGDKKQRTQTTTPEESSPRDLASRAMDVLVEIEKTLAEQVYHQVVTC